MRHPVSAEQLEWERTCSPAITADPIWKLDVYRTSLFLLHLVRLDLSPILAGRPTDGVANQLLDAAGSVSANIGEGYSRATRGDRLRFLGYSLGSVRECVTWYLALRGVLPDATIENRLTIISATRAPLLGLIASIRRKGKKDPDFED